MPELDELAAPGTEDRWSPDVLQMQAELVRLELWRLRREMYADPGVRKINVGAGQPVEQTIDGNRQDPYNGVIIYNPTPATLSVGFEAGTGWLAPVTVPPYTWAAFPERYTNLSIATLLPGDQQTTIATPVTIVRTRVPPVAGAGAYGVPGPQQALLSLQNASAAQTGLVLDNGYPRSNHNLVVATSAGVTAGTVNLDLSHDGLTWFLFGNTVNTNAANSVFNQSLANWPARFLRARISAAITGGTINATVASSG